MTAAPIWFGSPERPLFGFFHTPQGGSARAGVVVCPPLYQEQIHSHFALRLLAEQLEEVGICTLRFDYEGTGDSAGDQHIPDPVGAWLRSIHAAVEVMRGTGLESVVLVGMRMGAALAAEAAAAAAAKGRALEGLVLWDPSASGRAFLAEQRALSALSFGIQATAEDGSIRAPGMDVDPSTVRALKAIDLTKMSGPLARKVMVLLRPDRASSRLAERLDLPHAEWFEATGQADMMDPTQTYPKMPYEAIERIVRWIADAVPGTPTVVSPPPVAGGAVVAQTEGGAAIVETPKFVGEAGLFGILTEVPGHTTGPTVVLLSIANQHRIGPARLWVSLARQLATRGMRSFRVDYSGLGDSPTRHPGQERFIMRAPEAFDDVVDVCRALSPDFPSNVILIGLCSSAYQGLESAFEVCPAGVVAINPVLSFTPPEVAALGSVDPRRRIAHVRTPVVRALHREGVVAKFRQKFPRVRAKARDLVEVMEAVGLRGKRRPVVWLSELVDRRVDVLLICGKGEARPFTLGASPRSIRRLDRRELFQFEVIPELEHALLIADQHPAVSAVITEHLVERWSPTAPVTVDRGGALSVQR